MNADKESFVSGHDGTTVLEITTVLVSILIGYILRNTLLVCFPQLSYATRFSIPLAYIFDFSVLVLPGILLFTILADYATYICLLGFVAMATITTYSIWRAPGKSINIGQIPYTLTTFPFITALRTYTNLFTAIAILAVDFSIFPRRFAKTETYGTGLMDIGVGLFVVAHGLTAPEARGKEVANKSGYVRQLVGTGRRVLLLVILGMIRLASVKSTGYQEHVTEYGVHWNFFFTIATVRVLSTAILPFVYLLPFLPFISCSIFVASLHQLFLSVAGGTQYVLLGPSGDGSRMGLLSANREGVVSCIGYLVVYMASIELGRWLFKKRKFIKEFYSVCIFLGVGVVLLWTLTSVSEVYIDRVSRRMANITFIFWLFSQVFLILLLLLITDLFLLVLSHSLPLTSPLPSPLYTTTHHTKLNTNPPTPPLCVVSAIDYNQLVFFLLANLMTGLVNISINTLHTPPSIALCVLTVYMALLVAIAIILHRYNIKLKL